MEEVRKTTHTNNGNEQQPVDPKTQQFMSNGSSSNNDKTVDGFDEQFWQDSMAEFGMAVNKYADTIKRNAEQIAKAEASLGGKKKAIYNIYKDELELDSVLISKATDEQIDELQEAIKIHNHQEGYRISEVGNAELIIAKFQNPASLYSVRRKNNAVWCQNLDESNNEFASIARIQRKRMNEDEISALKDYTSVYYSTINSPLNGIEDNEPEYSKSNVFKTTQRITRALDKCQSAKDVWLQRGVSETHMGLFNASEIREKAIGGEDLSEYIGQEFVNNSFVSCGTSKGSGNSYKVEIIFNLYCPRGTKMHYIREESEFDYEDETIIQRGYHMVIKKINYNKYDDVCYIDLDVLVGSDYDRLTDDKIKELYNKYIKE